MNPPTGNKFPPQRESQQNRRKEQPRETTLRDELGGNPRLG